MIAALAAHEHAMAEARRRGDLRTVAGHRYPLPEGPYAIWQAEQRELRRKRAAEFLKRVLPRHEAERAFA